METERCPQCAASVPPGAGWCGLCYAVLRPEPEPAPAQLPEAVPVSVGAAMARPAAGPAVDPLTAPLHQLADAPDPVRGRPTWPCTRCKAVNDVDDQLCRQCGAGFLAGVETHELVLPGIGSTRRLERSHKVALVVAGSLGLMLFLVGLSVILGALL